MAIASKIAAMSVLLGIPVAALIAVLTASASMSRDEDNRMALRLVGSQQTDSLALYSVPGYGEIECLTHYYGGKQWATHSCRLSGQEFNRHTTGTTLSLL